MKIILARGGHQKRGGSPEERGHQRRGGSPERIGVKGVTRWEEGSPLSHAK